MSTSLLGKGRIRKGRVKRKREKQQLHFGRCLLYDRPHSEMFMCITSVMRWLLLLCPLYMIKQGLGYWLSVTQLINGKAEIQIRHFGSRASTLNYYIDKRARKCMGHREVTANPLVWSNGARAVN